MFFIGAKKKSKAKVSSQLETDGSSSNTPQPPDVAPSKEPEEEEDHYTRFEAEQQWQEDIWRANRTAKRSRINDLSTDTSPAVPSVPVVDTHELRNTELPAQQISEELIRTSVTPRKVRNVQETLKKATQ